MMRPAPAGWTAALRGQAPWLAMVAPLVIFVIVTVIVPVAMFLFRAVDNSDLRDSLSATSAALADWRDRKSVV